eukprot:3737012-Karenia_brevis.AAC.1
MKRYRFRKRCCRIKATVWRWRWTDPPNAAKGPKESSPMPLLQETLATFAGVSLSRMSCPAL